MYAHRMNTYQWRVYVFGGFIGNILIVVGIVYGDRIAYAGIALLLTMLWLRGLFDH